MMKLRYHTKLFTIVALFTVVLGACSKVETAPRSLDGKKREMVRAEMGAITMDAGIETKAATATTPMAVGSTFRLYAFEKGKTNMDDLVATHTYTISSTEPGLPVKDKPDELLYLPVGEVDIYLVGPVDVEETIIFPAIPPSDGNAEVPEKKVVTTHKIAHEMGVSPRYGCDLVASKSTVTIVAGEKNEITLNALRHRMARMNIEVSRKEGATYTDLDVKEIKIYNQATTSSFTFGEDGGEIAPVVGTENVIAKKDIITEVTKGERYITTLYMIPRPEDDMKIEVNFTCKLVGSSELIDKRLESGLIRASLVGGKQNYFWSNPVISSNILWRTKILPWDEVSQGDMSVVSDKDLVFSYSALDAPITIDGEKYWRDRSGNGRHAKLVGAITYDAVNKCYMCSSADVPSHFLIPELGVMKDFTLEVATEATRDSQLDMYNFKDSSTGGRSLVVHLPWERNKVYFDVGGVTDGVTRVTNESQKCDNDLEYLKNFATYFFTHTSATRTSVIGKNGTVVNSVALSAPAYLPFNVNKLFSCRGDNSAIAKLQTESRIYAARMYKKAITAEVSKLHYEADMSAFCGFNTKGDDSEYIRGGLILNLDGTSSGSRTNTVWTDQSEYKNNATVQNGQTIKYYGNGGYQFTSDLTKYFKLDKSLGRMQDFTVEFVFQSAIKEGQTTLFHFSNAPAFDNRIFHSHFPYNKDVYIDSPQAMKITKMPDIRNHIYPYGTLPGLEVSGKQKDISPYEIDLRLSVSVSRKYNDAAGLSSYFCCKLVSSTPTGLDLLPEMRYCYIGREGPAGPHSLNGELYAVRVYNRVLTDKERRHNYLVDKKKYNIL